MEHKPTLPGLHTSLRALYQAITDPFENAADRQYRQEWRAETNQVINAVMGVGDRISPLESSRIAVENALEAAIDANARARRIVDAMKKGAR